MIARLFQILFFVFLIYLVIGVVKFIFRLGKTTAELNSRLDEKKRDARSRGGRGGNKKDDVIELDRDQYKVE
jgi:type III secretory pathway component EscU